MAMNTDNDIKSLRHADDLLKRGFASMLQGGVIMDVVTPEQAAVAETAGAVSVMALERVPADIRKSGGVARTSHPDMITGIIDCTSIPVMAKSRIGHEAESQVLQALGVDMVDESEVLTPADPYFHINKNAHDIPFVCGATGLGEAVRRIYEGAAMIRTKGEAGSGNIVEAVKHMRAIVSEIKEVSKMNVKEIEEFSMSNNAPIELLKKTKDLCKLPVPNFSAGGIATPADASLMMQLGAESLFVGSGIFKSEDPSARAEAIVQATTFYDDPQKLANVSEGLKDAMEGLDIADIPEKEMLQNRGW